eukprot:2829422-Rhodomonas_salina.1
MTQPDLGFVVSELSRFLANPGKEHMDTVIQVLQYLKETRLLGLNCKDTSKSVGGFVFKYSGAAVSWKCKRQPVVALLTAEAEYIAASKAAQEVIYLQLILLDLGEEIVKGCVLHEDNEGCIDLGDHPSVSDRTKHIDIQVFFLRQAMADGHVLLVSCRTNEMTADMMTKALSGPALRYHQEGASGMCGSDYLGRTKKGVSLKGSAQQVQQQHHYEMMWSGSLGVGDIGIKGGRSLQGARGPDWDSRD